MVKVAVVLVAQTLIISPILPLKVEVVDLAARRVAPVLLFASLIPELAETMAVAAAVA